MYLGSVKFFKHLIYLFLVITLLLGVLGVKTLGNLISSAYAASEQDNSEPVHSESKPDISDKNSDVIPKNMLPKQLESRFPYNTEVLSEHVNKPEDKASDYNIDKRHDKTDSLSNPNEVKLSYQSMYPGLYNEMPVIEKPGKKTAYLTFDDGPSARTLEILDILKERNIKATFFVITENNNLDILKQIADEGHAIGVHGHTHKYSQIYKSVEAFLDDFSISFNKIYEMTSIKPKIFRFPGGSINAHNRGIYQEIISEMLRRGFLYYDWNVSTQDTSENINHVEILSNVKEAVNNQDSLIILCHDSKNKYHTVEALPGIIDFLEDEGYSFDKLDNNVEPITFSYQ